MKTRAFHGWWQFRPEYLVVKKKGCLVETQHRVVLLSTNMMLFAILIARLIVTGVSARGAANTLLNIRVKSPITSLNSSRVGGTA